MATTSVSVTNVGMTPGEGTPPGGTTPEAATYQFILAWVLVITLLVFANKTAIGHVMIYYSLVLLILVILLAETNQIAPILSSLKTIGQLNQ